MWQNTAPSQTQAAMIEKANVEKILERLREVEAQLAEPGTAADQRKYRGLVGLAGGAHGAAGRCPAASTAGPGAGASAAGAGAASAVSSAGFGSTMKPA